MNDNQNYNVRDGRTTSRVLAPPGGRSSLTLGIDPTPVPTTKKVKAPPAPEEKAGGGEEETVSTASERTEKPPSTSRPVSANAFAASANINGAQVMTGRPTSRVLKPGGGGGPTQWTLG